MGYDGLHPVQNANCYLHLTAKLNHQIVIYLSDIYPTWSLRHCEGLRGVWFEGLPTRAYAVFAYAAMVSFCFRLRHEVLEARTTNIITNLQN